MMTQIADPTRAAAPVEARDTQEAPVTAISGPTLPTPLVLRMPFALMNDDQFFTFCRENEILQIERTAEGDLIIMPSTGGETSDRNAGLTFQLYGWAKRDGTGVAFASSGGFRLPNGATRGADAAWVTRERLASLTLEQKQKFLPVCPDFVVELRSPSDRLTALQKKMREYLANGVRLGWLIDPEHRHVCVYRPDVPMRRLDNPATVSGDPELPGFVLDAQAVFDSSL
jgi:Uma2 family endonuclease